MNFNQKAEMLTKYLVQYYWWNVMLQTHTNTQLQTIRPRPTYIHVQCGWAWPLPVSTVDTPDNVPARKTNCWAAEADAMQLRLIDNRFEFPRSRRAETLANGRHETRETCMHREFCAWSPAALAVSVPWRRVSIKCQDATRLVHVLQTACRSSMRQRPRLQCWWFWLASIGNTEINE